MKRFIITEDEKKRILNLYNIINEQNSFETIVNNPAKKLEIRKEVDMAIDWWRNWLNHPSTKERFIKNNGVDVSEADNVFKQYMSTLNKIDIILHSSGGPLAWVDEEISRIAINVNLGLIDRKDKDTRISVYVHEIEHILYLVRPLSPDHKVIDCFKKNDRDIVMSTIRDICHVYDPILPPKKQRKI